MGAWGWKLFQNDDACDIQDSYKEKLIVGQTDEEAEKSIIEEFELNRNLELWIPLAVTEWKVGRLGGRAKENALRGIEEELSDLENRWKPEYISKRRDELLRVREQLQTEMPPKKKLRLPSWAWKCPWPVGSVLQYKLHYLKSDNTFANQYVLLLIQGISETPPGKIPCETIAVSLYNWIGTQAPADAKCEWNDPPKLIDFITKNGHRYETYSILLSKDQIRESEVKCIRNKPFLPEDYKASKASGANNVYFEEAAFLTLYK